MEDCITRLAEQDNLDQGYDRFCNRLLTEMDDRLPSRYVILGGQRKLFEGQVRRKPWWNEELATAWDKLGEAEGQFRQAPSDRQKEMRKQRGKKTLTGV